MYKQEIIKGFYVNTKTYFFFSINTKDARRPTLRGQTAISFCFPSQFSSSYFSFFFLIFSRTSGFLQKNPCKSRLIFDLVSEPSNKLKTHKGRQVEKKKSCVLSFYKLQVVQQCGVSCRVSAQCCSDGTVGVF